MTAPLSRRRALSGAATLGVSLPLLAACSDDGEPTASDPTTSDATSSSAPASSSAPSETSETSETGAGLIATADVPVGSGVIIKDEKVVVAQPAPGEFKAWSATCTHKGCIVSSVADATIVCGCHGSQFSIADGSVTGGPAPTPLAEVPVTVSGGQVQRA